jgi:hypothetical protein
MVEKQAGGPALSQGLQTPQGGEGGHLTGRAVPQCVLQMVNRVKHTATMRQIHTGTVWGTKQIASGC